MSQQYVWKYYCSFIDAYETVIATAQPTICPNHAVALDPNLTTIVQSEFYDVVSRGYVNIESQLADNQALKIYASDPNGGIDITAGLGGIEANTTNSIQLTAGAASNFTTSNGNLTLEATAGLVNIISGSGMNFGNDSSATPINIGTAAFSKNVSIGNNTGTTAVAIRSGTGKILLNSADTTATAIQLYSLGGIDLEAVGLIRLASTDNTVSAITLDASFAGGGIIAASGAQGIFLTSNGGPIALGSWSGGDVYIGTASVARAINIGNSTGTTSVVVSSGSGGIVLTSNGGPIGIGSWSGGDLYLGTAAVARTINIGNSTATTSVVVSSGTGGIIIGNDANTGEIQMGNVANAKIITIGNSTGASRLVTRFGTGGHTKHQEPHVTLSDADATLTIGNILVSIFTITPTVDRILTLPTASSAVGGITGVQIGDAIDFTIINNSTPADEASITLSMGTGGTMVGNNSIAPKQNNAGTYFTSGSGTFRIRFTNISAGTEAYTVYRIS